MSRLGASPQFFVPTKKEADTFAAEEGNDHSVLLPTRLHALVLPEFKNPFLKKFISHTVGKIMCGMNCRFVK